MDESENQNTDESRQSKELHRVPLERQRQLEDDDKGTKTFHMAPRQNELGWPDGYSGRDHWPVYDPFTGLRTAAVLGGLMLLMLVYILYKTRCGGRIGRRRWTSKDRLFVERYKRKVQERYSDSSMRRRRDTLRATTSRSGDKSAADKQTTTSADRRRSDHSESERRRRHRHHSVNEAITHLDVRVPLRVGQDFARPAPSSAAEQSTPSSGHALDVSREKPPPVAVIVEDSPSADLPDRGCLPPPRFIDLAPRAAARRSTLVGVDVSRLGRRCRSLDNVSDADDHRTYALLMIAN